MSENVQELLDRLQLPSSRELRELQAQRLAEAALLKPLIAVAECLERRQPRLETAGKLRLRT
jgi:hypothetical protein